MRRGIAFDGVRHEDDRLFLGVFFRLFLKAAEIVVESSEPIAWTVDGEMGGTTAEARVRNCYRAIRILKPEEEEYA